MKNIRTDLLCAILCVWSIFYGRAAVIRVPSDQPTIQAGIDASVEGDTVLIADGTFSGDGNRDINFSGKAITVQSENGASACIIDCAGSSSEGHRGFLFYSNETMSSSLVGLTIINGYVPNGYGGAIYCDTASPEIRDCIIDYCGGYRGGAIYCANGSPVINNSTISNNSTFYEYGSGGGLYLVNASPVISNCLFYGNYAYYSGGAIYFDSTSSPLIGGTPGSGNRFELNWALSGTDLGCEPRETSVNSQYNTFYGYCLSDYYVSPQPGFTLDNCVSELTPIEQTVYVSTTGDNSNDGLTRETAFATVSFAVSQVYGSVSDPVTIHICSGSYSPTDTGEFFPVPLVNYVNIEGDGRNDTILNVENSGLGFYGNKDSNVTLSDIALTNGSASSGGGVYLYESSPTIRDCLFTENTAYSYGGAVCCIGSSPNIRQNIFRNNYAFSGAGIFCDSESSPEIGGAPGAGNTFDTNYSPGGADLATYYLVSNPINATNNSFVGFCQSDYYVSPVASFNLADCSSQLVPIDRDVYVSSSGDDSQDGLSWRTAFRTIQHAMSVVYGTSANPVTIHLDRGVFSYEATGELFPLPCLEHVRVEGFNQDITILDASGAARVMVAIGDNGSKISNLTMKNGYSYIGSGLFIDNCSPVVIGCRIANNESTYCGGGIYSGYYSNPEFFRCIINNNSAASYGGGIFVDHESSPKLTECTISDNETDYIGAGCWLGNGSTRITNCLIHGNSANAYGGGMAGYYSSAELIYCTVTGNNAAYLGGAAYHYGQSSVSMENSILWNDSPDEVVDDAESESVISYSDVQGGFAGTGNYDLDPRFVSRPGNNFFLSHHQAGQNEDSPCFDSGNSLASFENYDTPWGTVFLNELTTRTDYVNDSGQVDTGYHFPIDLRPVPAMNTLGITLLILGFSAVIVLKKRL